jgi:hypothetical protein
MKKSILLVAIFLLNIATCFHANASVVLNSTNFPDANFRAYITMWTGVAEGGTITNAIIASVKSIDCDSKSIADMTGIKYFTALTDLSCGFNQLTALDVSHNTALTALNCSLNQLTALDLSHNTALTMLHCSNNQLTALDLSHNTVLTMLYCYSNQIASITLPNSTMLTYLDCTINKLTSLDVSHNTSLTQLWCSTNQITALDVTNNKALIELHCGNNKLTSLDVTQNTALTNLACSSNLLTSLDVSHDTVLTDLACDFNKLTSLDVSHNTTLKLLSCGVNKFSQLDVSHNTALVSLWCENTNLEEPYSNSTHLKTLSLPNSKALDRLYCYDNNLTTLDLSHNTGLTYLRCDFNNLSALDLSNNASLTSFLGANNYRTIKVYSYTRSAANGGGTGYYVPLTAQPATTINGVSYGATKALATLIDDAGQVGDPAFDITKAVGETSGVYGGATIGTLNGTTVLFLSTANKTISYKYQTGFSGTCTDWAVSDDESDKTTITAPNAYFTLNWDTNKDDVLTGVDGVESNDIDIYTANGAINIGGSFNGNVNVYNLRGQQVYCGRESEIAVPAGMYVVKVDGKVHKVLLK